MIKPFLEINIGRAKGIFGDDPKLKTAGVDTVLVMFFAPERYQVISDWEASVGVL